MNIVVYSQDLIRDSSDLLDKAGGYREGKVTRKELLSRHGELSRKANELGIEITEQYGEQFVQDSYNSAVLKLDQTLAILEDKEIKAAKVLKRVEIVRSKLPMLLTKSSSLLREFWNLPISKIENLENVVKKHEEIASQFLKLVRKFRKRYKLEDSVGISDDLKQKIKKAEDKFEDLSTKTLSNLGQHWSMIESQRKAMVGSGKHPIADAKEIENQLEKLSAKFEPIQLELDAMYERISISNPQYIPNDADKDKFDNDISEIVKNLREEFDKINKARGFGVIPPKILNLMKRHNDCFDECEIVSKKIANILYP